MRGPTGVKMLQRAKYQIAGQMNFFATSSKEGISNEALSQLFSNSNTWDGGGGEPVNIKRSKNGRNIKKKKQFKEKDANVFIILM